MTQLIDKGAAVKAVRDTLAGMEWPPTDGDAQIDAVLSAIAALPAAPMGVSADTYITPWEFAPPYTAFFSGGLGGDKWLGLKAHGVLVASFAVSSWGSEQACIEAAWRHAYEPSAPTLGDALEQVEERLLAAIDNKIGSWGDDDDLADWVSPAETIRAEVVAALADLKGGAE